MRGVGVHQGFSGYVPAPIPPEEAAREAAVRASGIFRSDLAIRLHDLVMQARHAIRTNFGALTIVTGDRARVIARVGIDNESASRAESFCGHAILRPHEITVIPDASQDERFAGNPYVVGEPRIRFYAGAPLVSGPGHALGTLCVFDSTPRAGLSSEEAALLRRLADRALVWSGHTRMDG